MAREIRVPDVAGWRFVRELVATKYRIGITKNSTSKTLWSDWLKPEQGVYFLQEAVTDLARSAADHDAVVSQLDLFPNGN